MIFRPRFAHLLAVRHVPDATDRGVCPYCGSESTHLPACTFAGRRIAAPLVLALAVALLPVDHGARRAFAEMGRTT